MDALASLFVIGRPCIYVCYHPCLCRREALQQFSPRQLRLMFIMSPWNKTISYGETMRAEMRAREAALKNFFQNVDVAIREASKDESSTSSKWQVRFGVRSQLRCEQ